MNIRKKLILAAAIVLPLSGLAVLGGVQAASAGGGPILSCPNTTADSGTINFDGGSNGIYLNSNAGQTGALVDNALGGATGIVINRLAIAGQTLTIAGVTTGGIDGNGTFRVAGDVTPDAPSYAVVDLTLTTPLPTTTAKGNILAKAKAVVTVAATDGTNDTTLYNTSQTENMSLGLAGCASSVVGSGEYAPNEATVTGTATVSNAATGLEGKPANLSATVAYPPLPAGWGDNGGTGGQGSSSLSFTDLKADTINLSTFAITYGAGVVTGDFASAKAGTFHLNALDAMTVCTEDELLAIQDGTGPDYTGNGGNINMGDDPLSVCDGGTLNLNPQTGVGGAYPANGLGEILAAETKTGGGPDNGGDGAPGVASGAILGTNSGRGTEVV